LNLVQPEDKERLFKEMFRVLKQEKGIGNAGGGSDNCDCYPVLQKSIR
jgi:hypothetical protein